MSELVYDASHCMLTSIVRQIGGRWKPILLHLIRTGTKRFGEMCKLVPAISAKVLTTQLRELESDGLIIRQVYTTKAPHVVEYTLTEKGAAARALLDNLVAWGIQYASDDYPNSVVQIHAQQCKVALSV